ncbi:MAG: MBL fold metallo-hydrolase [Treponema sp.]|nr:MBL fold metallo-hydrolase [Treponema sp.]
MNIQFWGVRGSLAAPLSPQQIQAKINSVIQRMSPADALSPESKEKFISSLPEWLYGTVGGNSPCVEVTTAKDTRLIFDAGTGIRLLGKNREPPADKHYHLFFSHLHWDHIQGLPFFDPAYDPETILDIYSPLEKIFEYLDAQMRGPYYPVTMNSFTKHITFHKVNVGSFFPVDDVRICSVKMAHPGDSYAYAVQEGKHKFVYATDVELLSRDFEPSGAHAEVFKDADVLVIDAQYTVEEAFEKQNWGHSAFCYAIDFALTWNIKKVYLFHHEPTYDDRKLHSILQSARWYANYISHNDVEVYLAVEGQEILL